MTFSSDEARGTEGLTILKRVTNPAWLKQPQADLTFFRRHGAKPFYWSSERRALHRYDKNAMHLATCSSVKLGTGEPIWYEQAPMFEDRAGLWHITIAAGSIAPLPLPCKSDTWVYTPTALLLANLGYTFALHEALLFPEQHQALRPFYEHLSRLRLQDKEHAKQVYTTTLGMLARPPKRGTGGYLYRPDWYYTLVAESNARVYRQMVKVYQEENILPAKIEYDSLYYEQPVQSLPIGPGIGQYKYTCEGGQVGQQRA